MGELVARVDNRKCDVPRKLEEYNSTGPLYRFVQQCANTYVSQALRRRLRTAPLDPEVLPGESDDTDPVVDSEVRAALRESIQALPDRSRLALQMKLDGRTNDVIASKLGLKAAGSVTRILQAVVRHLQVRLGPLADVEPFEKTLLSDLLAEE